jgi:uncharacterized membrane protein
MKSTDLKSVTADVDDVAQEVHLDESVTVHVTPETAYRFWRNLEALPSFLDGLKSVQPLGGNQYHWIVQGPMGLEYEWDAEIYNEKENELLAWRSIGDADVANAGTVRFEPTDDGFTKLHVILNYNPVGGKLGVAMAKMFGSDPGDVLRSNLLRLKALLER